MLRALALQGHIRLGYFDLHAVGEYPGAFHSAITLGVIDLAVEPVGAHLHRRGDITDHSVKIIQVLISGRSHQNRVSPVLVVTAIPVIMHGCHVIIYFFHRHLQGSRCLTLDIRSTHGLADDLRRGQLQDRHLCGPQLGQRHGDIPICGLGIEPIVCHPRRCRIHLDLGPGAVHTLLAETHTPGPGIGELTVVVLHHGLDLQVVILGHGGEGVVC